VKLSSKVSFFFPNCCPLADRKSTVTTGLGLFSIECGSGRLYLVDTPGFNDTRRSDVEIVKELSFFLRQVYASGVRLAGVINLHRITDNRATGSAVKSFRILNDICGPEAAKFTVLVTTMWNNLEIPGPDFDAAVQRENELKHTEECWGSMCRQGSYTRRWTGDEASARSIMDEVMAISNKYGPATLRIQRELVDECLDLDDTCVGRQLTRQYGALWQKLRKDLDQLKQGFAKAAKLQNRELAAQLRHQQAQME
jgi:hypothetical protein